MAASVMLYPVTSPMPVFDGDALLFYCPEASGYIYTEPVSSISNLVTVFPSKENLPHFPNIDFAAFHITHGRLPSTSYRHWSFSDEAGKDNTAEPMSIVYGSTVKLQHRASSKYLAVTPNNSAWLDKGNSEASLFRLVPPHQEKGFSDDLTINDSIKLESIFYKGYRIKCVNNPLKSSYHLVLSVTGSIFSVKSHCYKCTTLNPQYIKGGSVILLSSLKIDGYISVKGSFVNDKLPEEFKRSNSEVGLRKWRQGFFKVLPYSGDTFFQLEKTTQLLTGNPFLFGEQCRIKHLPTQQYISVSNSTNGSKIVVQNIKEANGSELFRILPLNGTALQEEVCIRDKIVLQHVSSQKLLAVNVKPILQTKHLSQRDHFSQWFGLVLEDWKDAVPTTCQYELLKAEEDAVIDIYYVVGLSTSLCNCLKKVSMLTPEDELDQKMTSSLFQDLMSQMTGLQVAFNDSLHKKRLANMLRSLQTVDAMITLLMKMTMGNNSPLKHQACISICSALEKYVENGNFKSRHYLAKKQLLGSLMSMVGRGIGTEKILIALLKDDAEMGDLMQHFLISFIGALDTEDAKVAELMTALAFCGRRFNKQVQDKIYERTLATGTVNNFQVNTDVQTILDGFVRTVGIYLEKCGIDTDRKSSTYNYLQLSLKLDNKTGTTSDEEHMSLNILSMKQCMHHYLSTNEMHVLYTGEEYKGRNSILAQVLGVLVFLIGYGVYNTDNDVSQIVHILIKILNGKSDEFECTSEECFGRYSSDTPGNKIVFTIKSLALQCLHSLIKQHFHSSVKALLYDFKCLRGEGEEKYIPENIALEDADLVEGPAQNGAKHLQTEISIDDEQLQPKIMNPNLFMESLPNAEQIELEEIAIISMKELEQVPVPIEMNELLESEEKPSEKLCVMSHNRLRYNFRKQVYSVFDVDTTGSEELCSILLDLINYEDSDVCLLSADLLFQMFHVETILLTKAEDAYFTTPYTDVEIHSKMEEFSTMADSEQLLKQLLRNQVQDEEKLLNTLEMLSNFCVSSKDESEPNASNQGVAYSCGIFNVILEFVLEFGVSDEAHCQEKILSSCFRFLQKITRKNSRAQNKLFLSFNDFLEIKNAVASMTCLLSEVFSNNSSLCERLSEADIKKLFFASVSSSNPEHYELTVTLQTIIKNTEPATPLQEYISQLFLDHWQDNLGHLLGQENQTNRLNLLEQAHDEDPHLQLLLNISDLLASCAVGECQSAKSVCHQFYDTDELLLILVNGKIMSYRKLPFVRLLTWTFLNTERDSALACSQLASSRNFWLHIEEQISLLDESMFKEISSLTIEQKKTLQIKLKSLTKANWSINQWMKYSASVASLSGNLLYVIEGLLPMLSGFCYEMSLHLSGKNELCTGILTSSEVNIVKEISEKLLMLLRFEMICASGHVKSLKQCINNVTQFCETLHEPCSFNQLVLSSLNRSRAGSSIPRSSVPEVTLNQDLQAYVKKYSQAYDESSSEVQESLIIPNDPSFVRLIEFFTDDDECIRLNTDSLKVKKLTLILRNLIQKQKKQSLRILERARLEGVTLITLKLLCGVIFKRIARVPRSSLKLEEFQQKYEEVIQPIQTVLINEEIVETLIGLLHHPKDDIAFQVLACLNVLLYPGNEEAQKRITSHVNQQDQSLFIRVHQILRGAQSTLNKAKIGNAMAQIVALIPMEDDTESSLSIKILQRNKSFVYTSMFQPMGGLSPSGSLIQLSSRRRTAGIGSDGDGGDAKLSIMDARVRFALQKNLRTELIDHRITMALNVLSWLCDGQQKDMQDILRDEKTFSGSNIVSQVAFLLHGITEHLSENNINVAQGAVQALIEMCAGNYSNQVIAFKGQVIISIETVLQEDFTSSTAVESLRKLKSSSIELLEVLLEETDEKSQILAQWIMNQWNLAAFLGAMFDLWQAYSGSFNTSNREQLRNSVFRAYHVLRRIADYEGTSVNKLVEYKEHSMEDRTNFDDLFDENVYEAKRMWQYCQNWSRSIEVVYKAKSGKEILTRTYFPYDPHKHLNENEKNTILLRIKRNTPQEKLSDLLQWTEAIRSAHEWKKKVKSSWKTYWLLWASTMRHLFLFWITILINAIVLFVVRVPSDYDNGVCTVDGACNSTSPQYFRPIWQPDAPSWYRPVLYTLGSIHLILSMWMILQYYAKHWTNLRFEVLILKRLLYNAKKGLLRRRYIYQYLLLLNKLFCCGKFHSERPQPEKYFQIFFFSFEPLYRIFFVIFSMLGLISSGYFYCGCMIYLFLRNHVLLNVLRAVRKSALQLITIFILGLVVIYIYAVISFVLIPNYFSEMKDQFCQTLFQCFITITRLGLLTTLGSAIAIRPTEQYQPNFNVVGWRLLYDIVFFIVVTILGLNIVIAILVDRFSDLREEKDKIEEDNNSKCFVCNIKKDVFERNGLDFREHSQIEHNMWNYIHFVLYLDTLHPNDHNALEKYVSQRIPSKANPAGIIDFFPMLKAKVLPADYVIGEGDT